MRKCFSAQRPWARWQLRLSPRGSAAGGLVAFQAPLTEWPLQRGGGRGPGAAGPRWASSGRESSNLRPCTPDACERRQRYNKTQEFKIK
jgi:hypothetical protein